MKDLFYGLCTLVLIVVACAGSRTVMPEGKPTYQTVTKNPNASTVTHVQARLGFMVADWEVQDYGLWKTAKMKGSDLTLVASPLTPGQWSKWSD